MSNAVLDIYNDPPLVHGTGDICWKISKSTAQFLESTLQADWTTIETGCGLSTVLFALGKTEHTCVVPDQNEVNRIGQYCEERNISLEKINFSTEGSQSYLPKLQKGKFDLVLIDGCHAFPSPFIDWYYLEPRLKVGGLLLVDDIQVWTGKVLAEFLEEDSNWVLERELAARCCVFRKLSEGSTDKGWDEQPFVSRRSSLTRFSQATEFIKRNLRRKISSR